MNKVEEVTRALQLKDVPAGTVCYTQERINEMEIRETWYYREDHKTMYDYNVGIARLAIVQGDPDQPSPRYLRVMNPPCRDPGEADGRVPVKIMEQDVDEGRPGPNWFMSFFHPELTFEIPEK